MDHGDLKPIEALIRSAHRDFAARFPGDGGRRQPVHVVYGGMHLFTAQTPAKLGRIAQDVFDSFAETPEVLAEIFALPPQLAARVHAKVREKLATEPIEDFRIDAEDGYGDRSDLEEDRHVLSAAQEVATLLAQGGAPAFLGLRIKPLSVERAPRAVRTLNLFFSTLGRRTPPGFLVTLPKVTDPRQVDALVQVLEAIERREGLAERTIQLEVMIESGPGLMQADGRSMLPSLTAAARHRLFGAHVGAYDFTASLDISGNQQRLDHPFCDALRFQMKLAFAGTGVFLSDGATTELPLLAHKGKELTEIQVQENRRVMHDAWRAHARNVTRALDQGFFQGWDLHPGQLVPRYVALTAFFLEHRERMTSRLRNFVAQLGQATALGSSFDDAATGQGLVNYFLRGRACGALSAEDLAATGFTAEQLGQRDFSKLLGASAGG
jgi:citrate lyase beta subunit